MTVNSALNYSWLRDKFKIQPIKYIITCNETQEKTSNFWKTFKISLHSSVPANPASWSNDFLHVWFQFLREGIVNYIRHWNEIITVSLGFHIC